MLQKLMMRARREDDSLVMESCVEVEVVDVRELRKEELLQVVMGFVDKEQDLLWELMGVEWFG